MDFNKDNTELDVIKEEITIEEGQVLLDDIKKEFHDGDGQPYKCGQCSKNFKLIRNLTRHEAHVHGKGDKFAAERKFKWDQCDETFKAKIEPHSHKNGVHATELPFQCKVCPMTFLGAAYLKDHIKFAHTKKLHKCDQCSLTFKEPHNLTRHKVNAHGKEGKFACEKCGKNFLSTSELKQHFVKHSDERKFKCDQCDMAFKTNRGLHGHRNTVHATERSFQCRVCSKTFVSARNLSRHSKIVHPDKLHKCERCSLAFKTPKNLTRHEVSKHGRQSQFACGICGRNFISVYELKLHSVKHSDQRNFKCDQCDQSFKKKEVLTDHKNNVHASERPFKCTECPRSFSMVKFLKRHAFVHRNEGLFRCKLCSKTFTYKFTVDTHVKRIHKMANVEPFVDVQAQEVAAFDNVKVEPVTIYDPEEKRTIFNVKDEIEEEIEMDVKREPEEID